MFEGLTNFFKKRKPLKYPERSRFQQHFTREQIISMYLSNEYSLVWLDNGKYRVMNDLNHDIASFDKFESSTMIAKKDINVLLCFLSGIEIESEYMIGFENRHFYKENHFIKNYEEMRNYRRKGEISER